MKSKLLAAAVAAACFSSAQAEVFNKVTLSGKIIGPTIPKTKTSGNKTTITQKLAASSISNSFILDLLVQNGDLTSKSGYLVVEIFEDDGSSLGFFAYNSRLDDAVAIDPDFLSMPSDPDETVAESGTLVGGNITAYTSSFRGIGQGVFADTDVQVDYSGGERYSYRNYRVGGYTYFYEFYLPNYTAYLKGVSLAQDEGETNLFLDLRLTSKSPVHFPDYFVDL